MPGMRALLRLLLTLGVLGTALHYGWLQAAIGFASEQLGGPAGSLDPLPPVDAIVLLQRLGRVVIGLPDPWYSLALMAGGIVALILAAGLISGLVRIGLRLSGWLRDAFV